MGVLNMPLVGSRLKCERCREERPQHTLGVERIRLKTGPGGNRLCMKHFHEAWDEQFEECGSDE